MLLVCSRYRVGILRLIMIWSAFLCLLGFPFYSQAQEADSTVSTTLDELYDELDALFEGDSSELDLFALVDSLLAVPAPKISSLHTRIAYISQVTTAGRDLDIDQYGISPGLSFFHHSGFFADASGFINSEYEPPYYLTMGSLGYMHLFKNWLTTTLSHDFYLYHDTLSHQFNKSAQLSTFVDYKFLNLGVDYSLLYGNETAHRVMGNLSADINLGKLGLIKKVTLHPGASIQLGNASVVYIRQSDSPLRDLYDEIEDGGYPSLTYRELRRLGYFLSEEKVVRAHNYLTTLGYTEQQISDLYSAYQENQIHSDDVFGLMNYAFSLPVVAQLGDHFTLLMSYTYSIPVSLPNESTALENNGFFSLSLAYKLAFVRRSQTVDNE